MHSDHRTAFIFAHQDDEMGVFHALRTLVRRGERPVCIYLTNGEFAGVPAARRNGETLAVLGRLGVERADVHFTGDRTGIRSGELSDNMVRASAALAEVLDRVSPARIVTHAWEGGHEDHDAACWIALWHAKRLGLQEPVRQFSLYTREGHFGLGYRAFGTIRQNGPEIVEKIPMKDRIAFCGLLANYRSQTKTMAGLSPFFVWQTLVRGVQAFQILTNERVSERPHAGPLLYETRNRGNFERNIAQYRAALPLE